MVRKLELEIPDADYARLVRDAASRGQTPEQYLLRNGLPAANGTTPPKTMKFSDFFGTAEGGMIRGLDDDSIRDDLARESANEA